MCNMQSYLAAIAYYSPKIILLHYKGGKHFFIIQIKNDKICMLCAMLLVLSIMYLPCNVRCFDMRACRHRPFVCVLPCRNGTNRVLVMNAGFFFAKMFRFCI